MPGLLSTYRPLPSLPRSGLAAGLPFSSGDLIKTEEKLLLFTIPTGTWPLLWWNVGERVRVSGSAKVAFMVSQADRNKSTFKKLTGFQRTWQPECLSAQENFAIAQGASQWARYVSPTFN